MQFDRQAYADAFKDFVKAKRIVKSGQAFKIRLFRDKAENSLLIANNLKDLKPSADEPRRMYWDYWAITVSYYSMLYAAKAAILLKGYEVKDHDAAQVALGYLLVPDELEKETLEMLNQAYKIFEDEYVKYFEDAKAESHIARYAAIKTYTRRRLDEIFENATSFIAKISLILR